MLKFKRKFWRQRDNGRPSSRAMSLLFTLNVQITCLQKAALKKSCAFWQQQNLKIHLLFWRLLQRLLYFFLYFVDCASHYKFLVITDLTHFLMYLFISRLYMFRASQRSSSGERNVLIHHPVWLVCVTAWYAGQEVLPDHHTKQSLTKTNHTRWCINTIRSPDDERCNARNM